MPGSGEPVVEHRLGLEEAAELVAGGEQHVALVAAVVAEQERPRATLGRFHPGAIAHHEVCPARHRGRVRVPDLGSDRGPVAFVCLEERRAPVRVDVRVILCEGDDRRSSRASAGSVRLATVVADGTSITRQECISSIVTGSGPSRSTDGVTTITSMSLARGLSTEVEQGRLEHRRVGESGEHHGERRGLRRSCLRCSDERLRGAGGGGRCLDDASRLETVGPRRRGAPVAADRRHDALELAA